MKRLMVAVVVLFLFPMACDDSVHDSTINAGTGTNDGTETNDGTGTNSGDSTYVTDLSKGLVVTTYGPVQGKVEDGVSTFLGIPYAAPPVGDLRWRPPQEPERWGQPRDATSFGPICPQIPSRTTDRLEGRVQLHSDDCPADCEGDWCCVGSEDCLYLNVWTPASGTDEGLPVVVWIHGGGLIKGTAADPLSDGASMAKQKGVVVVSFDYRLGPLGLLAHPELSEEQNGHSGNYALLDQIAALKWVKNNIRNFGGDPNSVTIVGESGGGWSVCLLNVSPLAEGLFGRGIIESRSCGDVYAMRNLRESTPRTAAISSHDQGTRAAQTLGCADTDDVLGCMRSVPVLEIFEKLKPQWSSVPIQDNVYKPTIDGYVLLDAPARRLSVGYSNAKAIITGVNSNEEGMWRWSNVFPLFGIQGLTLSAADSTPGVVDKYHELMRRWFGDTYYNDAISIFGDPSTGSDAVVAYERMVTDVTFACGVRRQARLMSDAGVDVYRYAFTRVPSGSFADRERLGVVHGQEIKYVFGNLYGEDRLYGPLTSEDNQISAWMMDAWTSFASAESPISMGSVPWERFAQGVMVIDVDPVMADGWEENACNFIDEIRGNEEICSGSTSTMPVVCLY